MKHQLPWGILLQIQPFSWRQWIYFVMMVGVDELSELTLSHCMDQQKKEERAADANNHEADPRYSSTKLMRFFGKYSAVEALLCLSVLLRSHTQVTGLTPLSDWDFLLLKTGFGYLGWHCIASKVGEGIHGAQGFKRLINATVKISEENVNQGFRYEHIYCDSSSWEKQFKCLTTCQLSCSRTHRGK